MKKDRNDLMVPLRLDLHRKSKLAAVRLGISLRNWIEAAVLAQLEVDRINRKL